MSSKKVMPFPGEHTARKKVSDETLVSACGNGEMDALGILFERHHMNVYRFLAHMAKVPNQELDDLVQETFIQIGKSAGRFRGKSSAKTWILAISANLLRRHQRTESRRFRLLSAYKAEPKHRPKADDITENRQAVSRLPEAIRNLPEHLRVVFVLCVLEHTPGYEAAKALGIPKGTVWRRLHQARKALQKALSWGES